MQTNRSIRIKAFILLFLLVAQTLSGFACAIDHLSPTTTTGHHHTQATGLHKPQQHDHHAAQHCCKEGSVQLVKADKLASPALNLPAFSTPFVLHAPAPSTIAFLEAALAEVQTAYALRDHHPPIADIRIAIQSFQI